MNLEKQYDYGVRSFMLDLHLDNPSAQFPEILLCHGSCSKWLPGITSLSQPVRLSLYLEKIADFLQSNPKDIITLHLESYMEQQGGRLLANLLKKTGLNRYVLPANINPNDPDLTLGELRRKNHRLIIFSDNANDDMISVSEHQETKYSLGDYPGCEMRAEGRDTKGQKNLLLLNHFYQFTRETKYALFSNVNSYVDIMRRANLCRVAQGRVPNFIAVDRVEEGSDGGARRVVLDLNKQIFPGTCQEQSEIIPNSYFGMRFFLGTFVGSVVLPWVIHKKFSYFQKQRQIYQKQFSATLLSAPAFAHLAFFIPYYFDFLPSGVSFAFGCVMTTYCSAISGNNFGKRK